MRTGLLAMAMTGGLAAFAACGLALALLGLGLPYVIGAALSGLCASLLIYSLGRYSQARVPGLSELEPVIDSTRDRLVTLERDMSTLRHELRGALSPALMVSDRLLRNDDPLVRRAGDAVVRSIERATALLDQDELRTRPQG